MKATEETALEALRIDPELRRLEELLKEFNLFDVLQIGHLELQHSWVIAWLLDPRGSHALGDNFLRTLLTRVAAVAQERRISVPSPDSAKGWALSNVWVARERYNIDILAISDEDRLALLIENKIFGDEIPGQLRRYWETVKTTYPGLKPFPAFLTPDGRKPLDERDQAVYVPIDYGQVANLIQGLLRTQVSTISMPVRSFLEQYIRTIRRNILDAPSDIDDLALQVYKEHGEAIDRINAARAKREATDWTIFDSAIEHYAPLLKADHHSKTYHRYFAPPLDEIPELLEGKGWTNSGRVLLFELRDWDTLWLDLVVGGGREETRQRLYDIGQKIGSPFRSSIAKTAYSYTYRKPILHKRAEQFDPDEVKPEVEQAIAEFFEQDYWPLVNGIREEFGLRPVVGRGTQ